MRFGFRTSMFKTLGIVVSIFAFYPSVSGESWRNSCRQMIVVTTADWEATTGRLCTLERVGARWVAVGKPIRVTVGRKGLGWGLGLHTAERPGPIKREGDKRAPAGLFRLESGFGVKALNLPKFDYRQTTENDFWVDDPGSEKYNQWVVSADKDSGRDWRSAEILHRPDGIYDYVIVVGHNRDPIIPGRGSAIFL